MFNETPTDLWLVTTTGRWERLERADSMDAGQRWDLMREVLCCELLEPFTVYADGEVNSVVYCDEEGGMTGLPFNSTASYLRGYPIAGDVVIEAPTAIRDRLE